MHRAFLLFTVVAGGVTSACSASSTTTNGSTGGSGATANVSDAALGPDAPTSCDTPANQRPDGGTCVLEAKGTVEDLAGAPLTSLVMTFCGTVCYGTQSATGGIFSIPVGAYVDTGNYAMHADGRPDHAVDYLRFAPGEPPVISVTMRIPALPPSSVVLPPDNSAAASVTGGPHARRSRRDHV